MASSVEKLVVALKARLERQRKSIAETEAQLEAAQKLHDSPKK